MVIFPDGTIPGKTVREWQCLAITALLDYVETTWLASSLWSPSTLSEVQTNNDVEGWHRRINGIARRSHVPFYMTVDLLFHEAQTVTL